MAKPKVRKEPTRAEMARRGVIALLAAGLVMAAFAVRSAGIIGGPDVFDAHVADAGGSLTKGADVKLRGVLVGKIRSVTADPAGGVRLGVSVLDHHLGDIPDNVVARVLPATIFGTSYLDLVTQGRASDEPLRAGATVRADTSQQTLELQQALDDIDTLVKTLRPAQLSTTLGSVAMALDGRGDQIGSTIDTLDSFLAKVEPQLPLIKTDLDKIADNLELLTTLTPAALKALGDSLSTMRTITELEPQIHKILTNGSSLAEDGNTFLAGQRKQLIRFLNSAGIVTDIYHDNRHSAFTRSFATIRRVAAKVETIHQHGFGNNTVVIQQGVPAYYTGADCPTFGAARGDNCGGAR